MDIIEEVSDLQCLLAESLTDQNLGLALENAGLSASEVSQILLRFLSFKDVQQSALRSDLAIRVALHLSPPHAVRYNSLSPIPRWKLVSTYISVQLRIKSPHVERLSRRIAELLDRLEVERDLMLSAYRDRLIARQGNLCACCGFRFGSGSEGRQDDLLKPYAESWEELTRPEVDHINPISGTGDNDFRNLQVLCRLCNWGKGFGLVPTATEELKYAAMSVEEIPRAHRARVFYLALARQRACFGCARDWRAMELTVEKVCDGGCLVLSNLRTICLECRQGS